MESSSNGDLPVDVIQEILLRLPVKTLMRFKCVCKQWCTLIESPTFANQHFSHPKGLLVWHFICPGNHLTSDLYAGEGGSGYEKLDHLQMPYGASYILGPLSGVFCVVSISGHIALFNPAMRQFRPIPSHCSDVWSNLSIDNECVNGFGFNPLSGDFTVVKTRSLFTLSTGVKVFHDYVCIYNSGRDSWRCIENEDLATKIEMSITPDNYHICLDGIQYWRTWIDNDDGAAIILALDKTENFQEIQVPDCIKYELHITLVLYGDSISLMSCSTDDCISAWVMKEVGCWTRNFTLGPIEDIKWPICLMNNTELVFETKDVSSLTLYNVSTGILKTIELLRKEKGFSRTFITAVPYKDSLVSIKGKGDNCILWDTSSPFVKEWFVQKRI